MSILFWISSTKIFLYWNRVFTYIINLCFVGLDGVDALLVYLEYSGCMFFWALYNYVTRRCKGNLMVHIMM